MAPSNPVPLPGDLVLTKRPGLTAAGRMEPQYRLEVVGRSLTTTQFATCTEALSVGRKRAEADGLDLWEETAGRSRGPRLRLEMSFRPKAT